MKKLVLAIALGTFSLSSALAETSFQDVDTDGDGGVSFVEAVNAGLPWSEDEFKAADKDASGVLDEQEFKDAIL